MKLLHGRGTKHHNGRNITGSIVGLDRDSSELGIVTFEDTKKKVIRSTYWHNVFLLCATICFSLRFVDSNQSDHIEMEEMTITCHAQLAHLSVNEVRDSLSDSSSFFLPHVSRFVVRLTVTGRLPLCLFDYNQAEHTELKERKINE